MKAMKSISLVEQLSAIKDYRQAWKVDHKLADTLFLTVCAVISGCEGWKEIEGFGHDNLDFLRSYGEFKSGVPSADTVARATSKVNPMQFQRGFAVWMQECHQATSGVVISLEDKKLRRSYNKDSKKALVQMISAFRAANSMALEQDQLEEKSEVDTDAPSLLKLLRLHDCL